MARRIFKYAVPLGAIVEVEINGFTPVLHFGMQYDTSYLEDRPTFWAAYDDTKPTVKRTFVVVGTGQVVPEHWVHCGTTIDGQFVWHLFELP